MPKEGSAQWFITYPRCDLEPQTLLDRYESMITDYAIVRETHDDGGFHLHAYFKLKDPLTWAKINPILREFADGDWQTCRSVNAVLKYLQKESTPLTNLELNPIKRKKLGKKTITVNDLRTKPLTKALEEGLISIYGARAYQYARGAVQLPHIPPGLRGYWIWGEPGAGKSRAVREAYPDAFIKPQNKWWDGYDNQKVVLLDDYDCGDMLGHLIKIWSDRYPCSGEVKGGNFQLAFDKFFITSNYAPSYYFPDPQLLKAIERRFTIIEKIEGQNIIV